ncbi:MAG: helix-turn-helix domain-containing protein [Sphingomonas sp.]
MTRAAILDAAETIMRDEGYAAVSSRKVASVAGLKSKLVHYYFSTMDELFLALLHRVEDRHFESLCRAAASRTPVRALWRLSIDASLPRLHKDFVALALHRERLRHDIARSAERARTLHGVVLARALEESGMDEGACPPAALAILMDGAARVLHTDRELGASAGHAEAIRFVEAMIDRIEPPPAAGR